MYQLVAPLTDASKSYGIAVSTIRDKGRRKLFDTASPIVDSQCKQFDKLAANLSFHRARGSSFDVAGLASNDMSLLYDPQCSKRKGTDNLRDSIRNAAPNSLCPYCGEGTVAQIDHYLPKESYAGISVHPANLVPACADCNQAKQSYAPDSSKPAVLHPYFDTAFGIKWLSATVEEGEIGRPVVKYNIDSDLLNLQLRSRLIAHMDVFKLWSRFSIWAGQSLDNFGSYLKHEHGQAMDILEARDHLERTALQQSGGRINSWEGAAHTAMRESDWYLSTYLGLT